MSRDILVAVMGVIALGAVIFGWWYESHGREEEENHNDGERKNAGGGVV